MSSLSQQDFQYVSSVLYREAGIALTGDKVYLVESRLSELSHTLGLTGGVPQLLEKVRTAACAATARQMVEAMTTNETSFFRDITPFDSLRTAIIPELLETCKFRRGIRIWSAASSTGQEAYSIAMMLDQNFQKTVREWSIQILGTDLAEKVLEKAREGKFTQLEVNRGLPASFLVKYFKKKGSTWNIEDHIKKLTSFAKLNLLDVPPAIGLFDVIMCRNVLIYFDQETKRKVLATLHRHLQPHGYLFLGAAEMLLGVTNLFERCTMGPGVCYRPTRQAAAGAAY